VKRIGAAVGLLLASAGGCAQRDAAATTVGPVDFIRFRFAHVTEILTGDTVVVEDVNTGRVVLRLAGVEAPEDLMWRTTAVEQLRTMLGDRRVIYYENPIQSDPQTVNAALQVESVDINEKMLSAGLARFRDDGSFTLKYREVAEEARVARRGLWAQER
jgi:endonuclease YncB( thermonuclease family)